MEKKIALILVMALSNWLMKILPVRLLSDRKLPQAFLIWLKYVSVPVLSAMLAIDLFTEKGKLDLAPSNLYLWVSVPTFLIAHFTKSLYLTVLMGIVGLAVLRWLVGY